METAEFPDADAKEDRRGSLVRSESVAGADAKVRKWDELPLAMVFAMDGPAAVLHNAPDPMGQGEIRVVSQLLLAKATNP